MTNEEVEMYKAAAIERTNNRTIEEIIEDDFKYFIDLGFFELKELVKDKNAKEVIIDYYNCTLEDIHKDWEDLIEEDVHVGMTGFNREKGLWHVLKIDGLYETLMERIKK